MRVKIKKAANVKTGAKVKNTTASQPSSIDFPVIGVGASAGGLDAFKEFFNHLSPQSGMAFVVVSHLDPTHISILPELIQRLTPTKVRLIEDQMCVERNVIYIAPPSKEVSLKSGKIFLVEPIEAHAVRLPINYFFTSLAGQMGKKAIGIIFSGTGSDGTLGCKAIKEAGGMIMSQDPVSAKYDGMPRSVIAAGCADFILRAQDMPGELMKYVKHPVLAAKAKIKNGLGPEELLRGHLLEIFALLMSRTGHDFSFYKQSTMLRRIELRMSFRHITSLPGYLRLLQEDSSEIDALFNELLIGVTSFFRDPAMFEVLKKKVLPRYLKNKGNDSVFRLWIPGCSTGEEVYSLVMIVMEACEALHLKVKIQAFATDINNELLRVARAGIYSEQASVNIKKEMLHKYFTREGAGYKIKKHIREKTIFASQNIISDPPFSKIDMICCRNVLIYLDANLQKKVLPMFFYSLKPGGVLVLGPSETTGVNVDLFSPIDKKWKVYERRNISSQGKPMPPDFPISPGLKARYAYSQRTQMEALPVDLKEANVSDMAPQALLSVYAPPSLVIDKKGNIIHVYGQTGKYLEPAVGRASLNVIDMARKGLRFELSAGIRRAVVSKKPVRYDNLKVKTNGSFQMVNLLIRLIQVPAALKEFLLVSFEAVLPSKEKGPKSVKSSHDLRDSDLEEELRYVKESLQTTVEELETSNEELKSSNEELQSNNEELQSSNEELETSKEELQSLNEELTTVNSELQGRIEQLAVVNDDIRNLFDSTDIAVLFLDSNYCIKRFTSKVKDVINVIAADTGRYLGDISSRLLHINLVEEAKKVVSTLVPVNLETRLENKRIYLIRILPYRTLLNVIDGAVVTFTDITERELRRRAVERMATIIADIHDAVILQGLDGVITAWNHGAESLYGYAEEEALGMSMEKIIPQASREEYEDYVERAKSGEDVPSFRTKRLAKDGTQIIVMVTITKLKNEKDMVDTVATAERAIAER